MSFDLDAYLDRLGLSDVPPGAAGLTALTRAHMRAIPFENIDPLTGRVPSLHPDALMDKLVRRKRGGYCFEHNWLFGEALGALGYAATPVLARVRNGAPEGGARTHQAFLVDVEGATLVTDVGFGGHAPIDPVPLVEGAAFEAPNGTYRFTRDPQSDERVLERRADGAWVSLWGFDDHPVRPVDIEAANVVTACWDKAPFRSNLMAAFHGPDGRVALFNRALTRGLPPDQTRHVIETRDELAQVLREDFTLALGDDLIDAIWAKIEDAPLGR